MPRFAFFRLKAEVFLRRVDKFEHDMRNLGKTGRRRRKRRRILQQKTCIDSSIIQLSQWMNKMNFKNKKLHVCDFSGER